MQFSNSDDQVMLAESLRGLLSRSAAHRHDAGRMWRDLADLGALGASLPEDAGGYGGAGRDLAVIAGELGRARTQVPFIPTIGIFATMIEKAGHRGLMPLLPRLVAGEITGAFAWQERRSRFDLSAIETTARSTDGGWVLSGRKSQVPYAQQADFLLVSAYTDAGPAVFVVRAASPGVSRVALKMADGQPAADIGFADVVLSQDALVPGGAALMAQGLDWGRVALAADTLACMDELLARTVDYIKMRVQFGKPIGRNQSLQHRATEMLHHVERSRGLLVMASESLTGQASTRQKAVAQASYIIQKAARFVAEQAIQLHGGMGMTDDLDVSHYVRRVWVNEMMLGDPDHHLETLHRIELEEVAA